jgi:hypothetical protein
MARIKRNAIMRLHPNALEEISKRHGSIGALADKLEVEPITIQRWIKKNDIMLTTADALDIICRELGLTRAEVLVDVSDVELEILNLSPTKNKTQ